MSELDYWNGRLLKGAISRREFMGRAADSFSDGKTVAHCASRSSGTLPVAGSAPEIAPDITNGPMRLALGIGLTCRAPATSMLRRFSMPLPPAVARG